MPHCFVIQPFDGGRFDKRYEDIFKPAIMNAGLEPYRVDEDHQVEIPIDDIEKRIRDSAICLADITLDNPNVWYEIGFAFAAKRSVCLVCSNERKERFPFDIQHRNIIRYECDSTSDFDLLRGKISTRLKALINRSEHLAELGNASQLLAYTQGLSPHEIAALCVFIENELHADATPSYGFVRDMESAGFTASAASFAVLMLIKRQFVISEMKQSSSYDEYRSYALTPAGRDWLINNQNQANLRIVQQKSTKKEYESIPEDDIPF